MRFSCLKKAHRESKKKSSKEFMKGTFKIPGTFSGTLDLEIVV